MLFTTQWLSTVFPNYQGDVLTSSPIAEVTTDSRSKTQQSLFIPLVGDRFDGHHHIKQALDQGAIAMIWDENRLLPDFLPANLPIYFVPDTLVALQNLAVAYRKEINPVVVGITGSNGKTTTKDLLAAIVETTYKTHYTKGNLNNHIGLPITILAMPRGTEVLILEMGMSDYGEIERLSRIGEPTYTIITNIGESHIEYLGSREGITQAKLEILHGMKSEGTLIIDGDEPLLAAIPDRINVISCGFNDTNDTIIRHVKVETAQTIFEIADDGVYDIPLLGNHHAQNASYAITLANQLAISKANIKAGLHALQLTGMRFELLKGRNDVSLINDAYNASPTSMKAAIEVMKQMGHFQEKVLILGDIFELGEQTDTYHLSVARVIESPITVVYTYGYAAEQISTEVKKHQPQISCQHFKTKDQLSEALEAYLNKDTLLLFKASRGMHFETLVETIQIKSNKI